MYGQRAKHVVDKAREKVHQKAISFKLQPRREIIKVSNIIPLDVKPLQPLHPSWVAKKSQGITEFKGTKMSFE